ncbi:hypothetical protein VTK73DRAFT_6794 [Phialemonium thermophilum]|uniref:Uncharacterized protein n=1 Tax=Phialemonium thermophilum TaxID=223376 RepID=A0ABR3Y747_9PEZI
MSSLGAIRYAAGTKKNPRGFLYLQCHVKPGASKAREGVTAVTEDAIEVCVAARPVDGEANKAVIKVMSDVLNVPKSDLQITQGFKSREKVLALVSPSIGKEEESISRIKALLEEAVQST